MLEDKISKCKAIAIIYETYHIVPMGEQIGMNLFTVEGVEMLVKDNVIPREVATIIYKLMLEEGDFND